MAICDRSLRRRITFGLFAALCPRLLHAAESRPPAQAPVDGETALDTELLKTGLFVISGGGANSLLRLSAAGLILVNGKRSGTYPALMSQVRRVNKLADLPFRLAIFTNHHDIHAGNHARFSAAGVATLVQANALPYLKDLPPVEEAGGRKPGPTISFDRAHEFIFGGVPVKLVYFGNALTDNDAVVIFPDLKVAALGELYGPGLPDYAAGGSLIGWSTVLDKLLQLDFELAVPSVGAPVKRADVAAFRSRLGELVTRVAMLVKGGITRDRLRAELEVGYPGWFPSTGAADIDRLYSEFAGPP